MEEVCRFSNVLKSKGIVKGDRVAIYMPMILEIVITMLACARIGAVHSIVVSTLYHSNIQANFMCQSRDAVIIICFNLNRDLQDSQYVWKHYTCSGVVTM